LPAGVAGSFSGGVFTISGTPTAGGTFNYTVTASGGCGIATATGTITVQEQTISLTSGVASPSVCANVAMANIVFTLGGNASGATLSGLPAEFTLTVAGNTVTLGGTPLTAGSYPYTITTTPASGSCTPATATGTITVQPAPYGGTIASVPVCGGTNSGTLTVLGLPASPGIVRWESSTTGGAPWTPIANTTISQTYTNISVPTWYRVVVTNGCGTTVTAIPALVSIHNYWTGAIDDDWNTAGNWSDNQVPSTVCPDVYIPNTPNKPILSGGATATITNLHILAGGQLTVNGTGLLQIGGTITNAGVFNAGNGTIEFNSAVSTQTIAASTFMNNAVHDLIISNSVGTGVTLGGDVDVYGSLTYGKNGAILNTGGLLTLKSTATETAWIGDMTSHVINGDVTVERFVASGTDHAKSWQLLAIPTSGSNPGVNGQTIKAAWQEGATATNISSPAPGSAGNPNAGYGTMLTSDVAGAATQPTPGFDAFTSPGPSIKYYNYVTEGYDGPPNTGIPIFNQKGYFVFVRGDRSVYTSGGAANPTVLRTKGTLFTPAHLPLSTNVVADKFESVGNPYASAIDMRKITRTGGVTEFFQVWDPRLGGSYNYGAFQTFSKNSAGDYEVTPGGGTYGAPGSVNNFIQSGQAFFVQATGSGGTVSFTENAKANSNILITAPNGIPQQQKTFRTSLYTLNSDGSAGSIVDGVLNNFDDGYSNGIDEMDARKSFNTGENLSIKSGGKLLVIERKRPITQNDTIFLSLTGVRVQQYQFHFDAENLNTDLDGFLEDSYLHTRTPMDMSGITDVKFTVTAEAASYAADRFRIVFAPLKALPVTFTSVKAYRQDKNINVEWRVENETSVKQYEVEKSTDGVHFATITIQAGTANGSPSAIYVATDDRPVFGYNYYRIKSVDINGKPSYTNIVKVFMGSTKRDITIHPNPITDGIIHLQLVNQPGGRYGIRLLNKLGQVIQSRQIEHAEGSSTELIKWDYKLAHGIYQLEVTRPDGSVKDINVLY
jgi:hypothetical protein